MKIHVCIFSRKHISALLGHGLVCEQHPDTCQHLHRLIRIDHLEPRLSLPDHWRVAHLPKGTPYNRFNILPAILAVPRPWPSYVVKTVEPCKVAF